MNSSSCLKCGHPRLAKAVECPNCGVIYHKAEAAARKAREQDANASPPKSKSSNSAGNSNESTHPCPHCNRPVSEKSKRCDYCGYDRKCVGCNRLVHEDDTVCPHCHFKLPTPKQYKKVMWVIYCLISYFFVSFLFMIKRPYFPEFNGEFYYTFKYFSLPIAFFSAWISYKACKTLLPSRVYYFFLLLAGFTFGLSLGTAPYVAAINYYYGAPQEINLKGRIVGKKICGGRSKSWRIEVKSSQLTKNIKFIVSKKYYNSVQIGDSYKRNIKKGSLGIIYVDRKK